MIKYNFKLLISIKNKYLYYIMLSNYIISLYWINKQLGGAVKKKYWTTLVHNGVLFPPEYEPIKIPIIYKEKEIILNPEAEEAALLAK